MSDVLIFTDMARVPATGVTSIAYVRLESSGAIVTHACVTGYNKTSQRAELYAIIYALRALPYPACEITVYTDCLPLTQHNTHATIWRRENADIWQMYQDATRIHDITLNWLRRMTHPYNTHAHYLARQALREYIKMRKVKRDAR